MFALTSVHNVEIVNAFKKENLCHCSRFSSHIITEKFHNFGTPEIFAVNYLKFKQRGQTIKVFCPNGANGIANTEDPDQTAPLGVV